MTCVCTIVQARKYEFIAMITTPIHSPKKSLTIGVVAERAGVGVETIRFYVRKGLVEQPKRPPGGVRVYPETTVERLEFIHHAQELGFTLREIGELLALQADPAADCGDVKTRAAEKLVEVEEKLVRLAAMRKTLRQLVDICPGKGDLDECSIVAALSISSAAATAQSATTIRNATMKSTALNIEGMHCQGCAQTVEMLLAAVPGVKTVMASYADHGAQIFYDPAAVEPEALAAAVARAGYTATVRP